MAFIGLFNKAQFQNDAYQTDNPRGIGGIDVAISPRDIFYASYTKRSKSRKRIDEKLEDAEELKRQLQLEIEAAEELQRQSELDLLSRLNVQLDEVNRKIVELRVHLLALQFLRDRQDEEYAVLAILLSQPF